MKKEEKLELQQSNESVKILITTAEYLITNKFIQLYDCVISNRENIEYQPEHVKCYNINLDIVHSCQILKD